MRHALPFVIALAALGCKPTDPAERARRNAADREEIQAEGVKLRQQNLCTLDAIAVAKDPDRHYLACVGFATPAGADPGILAFREKHGRGGDKATYAACYDPAVKPSYAVHVVLCKPAVDRLRLPARAERQELERAGRCANEALRGAQDPDWDYFRCYGQNIFLKAHIRLAEFRQRFGPAVDTIRARCPEISADLKKADERRRKGVHAGQEPAPQDEDLVGLAEAWGVFCTDEPPRGDL